MYKLSTHKSKPWQMRLKRGFVFYYICTLRKMLSHFLLEWGCLCINMCSFPYTNDYFPEKLMSGNDNFFIRFLFQFCSVVFWYRIIMRCTCFKFENLCKSKIQSDGTIKYIILEVSYSNIMPKTGDMISLGVDVGTHMPVDVEYFRYAINQGRASLHVSRRSPPFIMHLYYKIWH